MNRVFLLSPARCGGPRATALVDSSRSPMAARLRGPGAPLGDVFTWLSALYFRGKLTYARAFASPPAGLPGSLVIAPGLGLRPATDLIDASALRAMGRVELDSDVFATTLRRDARRLARTHGPDTEVVLLGSIATGKYVDALLETLGPRLLFPATFVGRGDMSRGGLLLRSARDGHELSYLPVAGAVRRGPRPPKLPPPSRSRRPDTPDAEP